MTQDTYRNHIDRTPAGELDSVVEDILIGVCHGLSTGNPEVDSTGFRIDQGGDTVTLRVEANTTEGEPDLQWVGQGDTLRTAAIALLNHIDWEQVTGEA